MSPRRTVTALREARSMEGAGDGSTPAGVSALAMRVQRVFGEIPGLRLTVPQAARLFGVVPAVAHAVLDELRRASVLTFLDSGLYSLNCVVPSEMTRQEPNGESTMADRTTAETPIDGSLRQASIDRLACLFRHWTWAEEALARFERELASGWEYDEDPLADHPFGSYYHWCALLCGFSEAALEQGLLAMPQLDAIRGDLEASLPGLRACRQLLVVIPASLEEQPRVVDLLADQETIRRLRRVHEAFGKALREERMSREIDALDH